MPAPPVHCAHDRTVPLVDLEKRRHPDNPNKHPAQQVRVLADTIARTGWRDPITVSNRSGLITKGHGRLDAAQRLGLVDAPVDFQDYADEAEEIADMIADYKIQQLSMFDTAKSISLIKTKLTNTNLIKCTGFLDCELNLFSAAPPKPKEETKDESGIDPSFGCEPTEKEKRKTPSFICPQCGFRNT
jgi:ParB-like nuclease domain